MRVLRRLIKLGAVLLGLSILGILAGTLLSKPCSDLADSAKYDIAVVLGGGMEPDGTLHYSTRERVAAGVEVFQSGETTMLHMTGGRAVPGGPAAGAQMSLYAQELGAPRNAITEENESLSTLQNALFSYAQLKDADHVLLVSEGFHLTRSWLSFRWAGIKAAGLCHSTRFRVAGSEADHGPVGMMLREVMAFWFNFARATVWSVLNLAGKGGPATDALLR